MGNPFGQARHLLQLGEDQNLEPGELQALYASGLQSVLFRATKEVDLSLVDREAFERVLGLDPSVFRVKMGGPENTDQIMAALGFPFNGWIKQKNFPLTPSETPREDEIEIVDPGCSFSADEGLAILAERKLVRPTYEHGIGFAQQFGTTTSEKKPFVVFLHEPWWGPGRLRYVVCLNRRAKCRLLDLTCPGFGFGAYCVLAGVRPHK